MDCKRAVLLVIFLGAFASEKVKKNSDEDLLGLFGDERQDENKEKDPVNGDLITFDDENEKTQEKLCVAKCETEENCEAIVPKAKDNIELESLLDFLTKSNEKQYETEDAQKNIVQALKDTVRLYEEKQKPEIANEQPKEKIRPLQENMALQVNPAMVCKIMKIAQSTAKAMSAMQTKYAQTKEFWNPKVIAELALLTDDPQSIIKNLKMDETYWTAWNIVNATKLVVEDNRLGFRKKKLSMFIEDEWKESFPISFTYQDISFGLESSDLTKSRPAFLTRVPDKDEVFLTITYGSGPKHGDGKIYLILVQKQPQILPQNDLSLRAKFSLKKASEEQQQIGEILVDSIWHVPHFWSFKLTNITSELQNFLENSTKIPFQKIKNIFEDSKTKNLELVLAKNVQQKKLAIKSTVASTVAFYNPYLGGGLLLYILLAYFLNVSKGIRK